MCSGRDGECLFRLLADAVQTDAKLRGDEPGLAPTKGTTLFVHFDTAGLFPASSVYRVFDRGSIMILFGNIERVCLESQDMLRFVLLECCTTILMSS